MLIAQIKLAWWRDRFRDDPRAWPAGEPLLERLAGWRGDLSRLALLVDGWEELLAEDLQPRSISNFAEGRAVAWTFLAEQSVVKAAPAAVAQAGREWALADLALHLGTGAEAKLAREAALGEPWRPLDLPRALRPLAVLRALAHRALLRGSGEALDGPGAALLALRIGLIGR